MDERQYKLINGKRPKYPQWINTSWSQRSWKFQPLINRQVKNRSKAKGVKKIRKSEPRKKMDSLDGKNRKKSFSPKTHRAPARSNLQRGITELVTAILKKDLAV